MASSLSHKYVSVLCDHVHRLEATWIVISFPFFCKQQKRTAGEESEEGFHEAKDGTLEPNDVEDDGQVEDEEDSDGHEEYLEASPVPMTASTSSAHDDHTFLVHSLGSVEIGTVADVNDGSLKDKISECIKEVRGKKKGDTPNEEYQQLLLKIESGRIKLIDLKSNQILTTLRISRITEWTIDESTNDFAFVSDQDHPQAPSDLLVPNLPKCHVYHCEDDGLESSAKRISFLMEQEFDKLNSARDSKMTKSNSLDGKQRPQSLVVGNGQESAAEGGVESTISTPDVEFISNYVEEEINELFATYLGCVLINIPSGVEILNGAIEKVVYEVNHKFNHAKDGSDGSKLDSRINIDEDAVNGNNIIIPDGKINLEKINHEKINLEKTIREKEQIPDGSCEAINIPCVLKISPTSIVVSKIPLAAAEDDARVLFEVRIRYLSFLGISRTDSTKCAFIHQVLEPKECSGKKFMVRVFGTRSELESGNISKHLERACQQRYEKCLDANKSRMKSSKSVPVGLKIGSKSITSAVGKMFSKMWPSK